MYYTAGRCVMKKEEKFSIPSMIGVALDTRTALRLAVALDSGSAELTNGPDILDVTLRTDSGEIKFRMNDAASVNHVMCEVMIQTGDMGDLMK